MGRAFGQIATSATTEVAVNGTAYTEQTSGAQRSVKSSSANDAAAGTGAQKVRVTYYTLASDGTIAGPFVETLSLNGTTAVPTVNLNIALIEKFEVISVGSGGVSAGTITLFTDNAGVGSAICTIAAGDPRSLLCHHYVPNKVQCTITDLLATGGDPVAALFTLKVLPYPSPASEQPLSGKIGANNGAASGRQALFADAAKAPIAGPARVRAYVAPANGNAQTSLASFGWIDQRIF